MRIMNRHCQIAALARRRHRRPPRPSRAGPVSALKGHDSNAPVDVAADRIEVQDRADRAIFAATSTSRREN